jgi:hypothetical protein
MSDLRRDWAGWSRGERLAALGLGIACTAMIPVSYALTFLS